MTLWCRVSVVGSDGEPSLSWRLGGPGRPDMTVVDDLARLQLAALRGGRRVVLSEMDPTLRELLHLAGLLRPAGGTGNPSPDQRRPAGPRW